MPRQNVYDDKDFFENFQSSRSKDVNFNDCIETPILFGMLPDLHGKKVLDIGCGMGQHAKQYSEMGAESVLGIDLSEKMLQYAQEHNSSGNIIYQRMAMEDIDTISETFDLVTSSLVFDYAEDFPACLIRLRQPGTVYMTGIPALKPGNACMQTCETTVRKASGKLIGL